MANMLVTLLFALTILEAPIFLANAEDNTNDYLYRLPNVAVPSRYDIQIEPSLQNFTFTGEVTIKVKILTDTKILTLNAKNLNITQDNVTLTSVASASKPMKLTGVSLNDTLEFLVITTDVDLKKNQEYNLNVKFSGKLTDAKRGFYKSRYFDKDDNVKYVAATHFEPTGARMAFPCWDEPAYKAVFSIALTYPKSYTALSNMPQQGESAAKENERVTTKFEDTKKMSSYLVAFIVSDYGYKESKNKVFRVWTKSHAVNQTLYALNISQALLKELDDFTNIKYSDYIPKMDQVSLKDFLAGAMENWGLVTYRERSLLYEEGVTTLRTKQNIASTIAHEFAHQWFGNLVSPKWWTYIWLNEGFADYFEYFITNEVVPEWRLNETFVVDNIQGNAFVADAYANVRPMNHDADSPTEIKNLFDSIAYQKSGSVIRMMSHILQKDVFKASLRKYLDKMRLSNADSTDLFKYIDEAAGQMWGNKVTFAQIMNEWVNKPGYPVVTVKKTADGEYTLVQEQFTLDGSAKDTKWWVPISYVVQSSADFRNTTPSAWLKPTDNNVTIKVNDTNGWIIVNTQEAGYYRVNYDEKNWELLSKYLHSEEAEKIHVLNRAQLIDDVLNMARTNRLNYTTALSFTLYLNNETDYIPWQTAFRNLNFLQNMLRGSKYYEAFKLYIRHVTKAVSKSVGYEAQKDENDLVTLLRTNVMKWACRADVEQCTEYVNEHFKAWLENTSKPLDINLKNTIICEGVKSQDEATWTKVFNVLNATKDEDTRKSLLSTLACSESPDILQKFLMLTLEKNAPMTFDSAVQSVVAEQPEGVDVALNVLINHYDKIAELDGGEDMIKSAIDILSNVVVNKDQYYQLSSIVVNRGWKSDILLNTVQRALKNIEWINHNKKTVEDWLTTHKVEFNNASSITIVTFFTILSLLITRFF